MTGPAQGLPQALVARLAKADLVSFMVGEFPEVQGVIGGYLARAEGLPATVADAIAEHYRPQGPADSVPASPISIGVALADKIDTLAGFFAIPMIIMVIAGVFAALTR